MCCVRVWEAVDRYELRLKEGILEVPVQHLVVLFHLCVVHVFPLFLRVELVVNNRWSLQTWALCARSRRPIQLATMRAVAQGKVDVG